MTITLTQLQGLINEALIYLKYHEETTCDRDLINKWTGFYEALKLVEKFYPKSSNIELRISESYGNVYRK